MESSKAFFAQIFKLVISLMFFCSCTSFNEKKELIVSLEKDFSPEDSVKSENSMDNLLIDLSCDKSLSLYIGGLQGLNEIQYSEIYKFGQCNNGQSSFDIIWVLDKPYEQRSKIDASFYDKIPDSMMLKDFVTYLFKLPLKQVSDPLLDDPYVFPSTVEVFALHSETNITSLGTYRIKSSKEYVQLQYKSIFKELSRPK